MRRVVDLVNASQAEINQVQLQKVKETYQVIHIFDVIILCPAPSQRHKTDTGSAHVQGYLIIICSRISPE